MNRSLTLNSTRSARRFLPTLEALESRWCPSSAGIVQTGHSLVINGDGGNDTIQVSDNGKGGIQASITLANGVIKTDNAIGISSLTINSGAGSDTISYTLTGALSQRESLTVNLGRGSNQADLDFSAGLSGGLLGVSINSGAGSAQLTTQFGALSSNRLNLMECLGSGPVTSHVNFGGTLSSSLATVTVNGGPGNDQVFAQVGSASNSNLQFLAHLGKGSNSFDLEETGSLQNSVVHFDIDAGSGGNSITFNAADVNVDATSRLNLQSCTVGGNDNVVLNYTGQMNGELDATIQAGAGNDTVNVTLTLAQGSTGRLHGHVYGGAGDDTMTFDVFNNSNPGGHSRLALLDAVLEGGSGHNTLSATPNVKVKY